MFIKAAVSLLVFSIFIFPAYGSAAPFRQPQQTVMRQAENLHRSILKGAAGDSTSLHAQTAHFLEELMAAGLKDPGGIELAGLRYAAEVQEQAAAQEFDSACAAPLLLSLVLNGQSILDTVASLDSPLCKSISLTGTAAVIISAKYSYDICVIDNSTLPDEAARTILVQQQNSINLLKFSTNALDLFVCTPAPTIKNYFDLLLSFLGLFLNPTDSTAL